MKFFIKHKKFKQEMKEKAMRLSMDKNEKYQMNLLFMNKRFKVCRQRRFLKVILNKNKKDFI